jgi:fatty-acyl-CoA synthase
MSEPLGSQQLTPLAFLDRAASAFAENEAVVDGDRRWTYREFHDRCLRQSGALMDLGVTPGQSVAVLAPNSHVLLEAHYGVPYAGAVLVALNPRLAAHELGYVLTHSEARVLLYDPSSHELARDAAATCGHDIVLVDGGAEYERRLEATTPLRAAAGDERDLLAINYTSGTTGAPKGVMYHHRGAYLQSLAMVCHLGLSSDSRYLWTLPMFHCNGWCFTWAVTAVGGTHVCCRKVEPSSVWRMIAEETISHLCAAPTVLISLVDDPEAREIAGRRLAVAVGGSPPSPTLLAACAQLGLEVTHLYGLTESFGPAVICDWRARWSQLDPDEQAVRRARQGVPNVLAGAVRLIDDNGIDIPRDGLTTGEVLLRGNNIMLGYFKDARATADAVVDGWFRTGDVGVMHADGYLELKDRKKDLIISGGENISSAEVEAALASHPDVLEAAVVGVRHERWGERPVAFVTLRSGRSATEDQLRQHIMARMAKFKVPDHVYFGPLPKNATGKIQKFILRSRAQAGDPGPVNSDAPLTDLTLEMG